MDNLRKRLGVTDRMTTLHHSLFCLIVFLALALRMLTAAWSLPYQYKHDEPVIVNTSLQMLKTGDYNPHFFNYGSLPIYLALGVDIIHYFYLMGLPAEENYYIGGLDDIRFGEEYGWYWTGSVPTFYLWNRWFISIVGTISIVIAYFLAREIGGRWAALLSAVLLSTLPEHVFHSTTVTPDALAAFFALGVVLLSVLYLRKQSLIYFVGALIACGLTAATKYNLAITLIMPLFVLVHAFWYRSPGYRWWLWFMLFLIPAITFVAVMPYAVLDLRTFLTQAGFEVRHYKVMGHGAETIEPGLTHFLFQLNWIKENLGIAVVMVSLVGLIVIVRKSTGRLLFIFFMLIMIVFSSTKVNFHRNFLVMYSFAAIAFGCGAVFIYSLSARLTKKSTQIVQYGVTGAMILALSGMSAQPLKVYNQVLLDLTPETRTQAMNKIDELAKRFPDEQAKTKGYVHVGVAEELHIHESELRKIAASNPGRLVYEAFPYKKLICTPNRYDFIVTAITFGEEDQEWKLLNSATLMLRNLGNIDQELTIGGLAESRDPLLSNPGILILKMSKTPINLPLVCGQ